MYYGNKYNIVILNHHASVPEVGGGGRHYELSKELSEDGHKIMVIASSYDNGRHEYHSDEDIKTRIINSNFIFKEIKTKPAYKNNFVRFINYIDYMIKVSKLDDFNYQPNVIIASSVHPLAWIAGYKLSKKYDAKFIVEVRDLWPLDMYEDFKGLVRKFVFTYFESLERKYYRLADKIITTAPYAYEYMEENYNINPNNVFHIPHGIDIEEFDKNSSQDDDVVSNGLREVLDNNFCVTYTGLLSRAEGLPTLVESAKYLKDINEIKILIVGSGRERDKLQNIIHKEELDNVIMIEKQPKSVIPVILKKSKILFCGLEDRKAFKYGISKNKFYDYMASGKPIIFASSVRDSLIDKAKAGITIKPGDPENLANTIRYIYNNIDKLGIEYGESGRKYVEENHTNRKIAEQFLNVIESCYVKSK
ncbi:glycosyltransferase family 4 protein [Anaerosalibacter sp. Marseille-P3206]|uniref:glycosyltransferase family 4 protein n=1 Tax=Anaerosalibacter sp. Marseille-P3206 TaxID=1871005 RepID=UPI001356552A|nr:glycosyltransferase family 4 protein [Anaerosalibacter sp. Marseille-P3206]